MEDNVYQSPVAETLLEVEYLDAHGLRERFARDELIVLAVGWFYYFFGAFLAVIGASSLVAYLIWGEYYSLVLVILGMLVGPVYIITGYGLRRFESWARIPALLAALVAMVIPPAGLLAGLVSFVLLKRHTPQEIFTERYQMAVMAEDEGNRYFGWLAILGGGLSGVTLSLFVYLLVKGVF